MTGLIGGIAIGLKFGMAKLETFNELKDFLQFLIIVEKIFLIITIVSLAIFAIYSSILIGRWIYTHKSKNPYLYLLYFQLDEWLQNVGIYLTHGEGFVVIPRVKRYKNRNELGLEIQILGDLRKKMLGINASLSSYLASKGSDWYVSESYECGQGYIRYIFSKGINSEQLKGDDLEI
ncbi:hypothetical protein [Bacillus subtilis]|uniref:hypothetical protein n=1 Tax=Bacillus subtilis TaxID=1423 RepID=UPI003F7489ED